MLRKLIKNSFSGAMVPIVKIAITFVIAPLIVRALGNYDYGIMEMVMMVVGYMGILDMGLMPAIVHRVARYEALKDRKELDRTFSTSIVFLFFVGTLLFLILAIASLYASEIFSGSNSEHLSKYSLFLLIISFQVFFTTFGSVFECFLEGLQHYSFRNITTIVFSLLGGSALFWLLNHGGGLLSVAAVNAIGFSLKYLFYGCFLLSKRFGGFRFKLHDISWESLKNLLSFGAKSLTFGISLRIASLSDSLVIGAVLGPAIVTLYIIPVNLVRHARTLVWAATRCFMPMFSELDAVEDAENTRRVFLTASRIGLGIILLGMLGVFVYGPAFLGVWMGPEYEREGFWVLQIIAAAYIVQWLNPFSNRFLTGTNQHGILAKVGTINALVNLALSLVLVFYLGKEGVALGTLVPAVFAESYILVKTCRLVGCSVLYYSKHVFLPLIIPASGFFAASALWITSMELANYKNLLVGASFATSAYLVLFVFLGLRRAERSLLFGVFINKGENCRFKLKR